MASKKRWTRSHGTGLLAGPALALTAALAAAGCTPAAPGTGSAQAARTPPAVTQAQARQAFDGYVAATARAASTGDSSLALSVVTGPQRSLLRAALRSHGYAVQTGSADGAYSSSLSIRLGYGRYAYGTPTFYLPEAAGFPRFFVAAATRTLESTCPPHGKCVPDPGAGATVRTGGAAVPVDGPALMLFEQSGAGAPWLLASVSRFPAGASLPRLATDSTGRVPTVRLSAAGLLATPDVTGPLQAAVVDDGPASAAAKAVADGPLTTGMYQAARAHQAGLNPPPAGDIYQWDLEGTPYPAFALRTADGGALVFYAMYLNATVAVPGYLDKADPIQAGPPIQVPLALRPFLSSGQPPRVHLEAQQLLSFAAIDPPPGSAKIQVIAIGGGMNYANAS